MSHDDPYPHLAGLSEATRQAVIADATRRVALAPPPSPAVVERLRVILADGPLTAERAA
ncbi:MAG: hypothetical protein M3N43_01705 [Actinomycetota bacterium]|nr:hypothetical protein [Actinomycetota bacterium]